MKLLIIGGTKFLGRHLVTAGLNRGHSLTLFNRGRTASEDTPDVESIHGDRHQDLAKLAGRRWDAVIDTCGFFPQSVDLSAEALSDSVGLYIFVSSISAYGDFSRIDYDEDASTAQLTAEQQEQVEGVDLAGEVSAAVLGEAYGALKALCERAAENAMPGRVLNVRSGLIVGRFDHTDRFSYWVMRVADGGEVLAPGSPSRFIQMIDAQDLAEWIVSMAEKGQAGVYNVTGKPFELTMERMLDRIRDVTASNAAFTWVSEEFLERENVQPWSEMPLYLPESDEMTKGFLSANIDKALASGLVLRPMENTISDTFEWRKTQDYPLRAGIDRAREKDLLEKWREQVR